MNCHCVKSFFHLQINSDGLLYSTVRYDDQHYLNMYSLQVKEDHEPLLVWSCKLGQACILALTEENLAVLVGKRNRTLYIVGPTGKSSVQDYHNVGVIVHHAIIEALLSQKVKINILYFQPLALFTTNQVFYSLFYYDAKSR